MIDFFPDKYDPEPKSTGVAMDTLKKIGDVFSTTPPGDFKVHGGMFDCRGTVIIYS